MFARFPHPFCLLVSRPFSPQASPSGVMGGSLWWDHGSLTLASLERGQKPGASHWTAGAEREPHGLPRPPGSRVPHSFLGSRTAAPRMLCLHLLQCGRLSGSRPDSEPQFCIPSSHPQERHREVFFLFPYFHNNYLSQESRWSNCPEDAGTCPSMRSSPWGCRPCPPHCCPDCPLLEGVQE